MITTLYIPQEDNTFVPLEINADDSSYHYREIMSDDNINLNFSLPDFIDLPVGTYMMYKGVYKYTLYSPENFKKNHSQHYDYTLTLESELAQLKTIKFKFFVATYENNVAIKMDTAPRLKFSFTGTPYEFAKLLADNLNLSGNGTGWKADKATNIESERVTLDFNHDYCFDVLTRIAEAFNTEWEIEGKEIRFAKVEKMKESAINLSYGYQKGILGGIQRRQFDSSKVINRVWIQGGDRNIRWDKYGSDTLHMPANSRVRFDGTYFDDDTKNADKFDEEKAVEYRTDSTGCYVERTDRQGPLLEDSLDVSKVYPMFEGVVGNAKFENEFWYIFDTEHIPDSLDFNKYILPSESPTVIFQTGMLTGREFDVVYTHNEPEIKRRFQLIAKEDNGLIVPEAKATGALVPKAGDLYGVFHIDMPEDLVKDAERRARNEAIKYLYENSLPKYTYDWQLDGIYAKREWGVSGGMLGCGNFVKFSDPQFLSEPVDIRITAVKTLLSSPLSPEITISNNVSGKSLGSIIKEIPAKEQEIERSKQEAIEFSKRRYRDAKETMDMLKESLLDFSEGINPIAVQTMMMLVGDESLQFRFLEKIPEEGEKPIIKKGLITYNQDSKQLECASCALQHLTLDINDIMSKERKEKKYKIWQMPIAGWKSEIFSDSDKKVYLYARCERDGANGIFETSATAKEMKTDGSPYYYFLVGILTSEFEGERSFVTLYGFTEVLPGRITTDRIVSGDGENFLDLANNAFRVGDSDSSLSWNKEVGEDKKKLAIRNATFEITDNKDEVVARIDGESGAAVFAKGNALLNADGSVEITGKFETNKSDNRIVINPDDNTLKFMTSREKASVTIEGLDNNEWFYPIIKVDDSTAEKTRHAAMGYDCFVTFNEEKDIYTYLGEDELEDAFDPIYGNYKRRFPYRLYIGTLADSSPHIEVAQNPRFAIFNAGDVLGMYLDKLPTSWQGLRKGQVWNDNGTLKIGQ